MTSWVRYCVAVYVGLLISGALVRPPWTAYPAPAAEPRPAQLDAPPMSVPAVPDALPSKQPPADPTAVLGTSATLTA